VSVLLVGLLVAGTYVYANTASYRKTITQAIAHCVGAKVEFKGFRVSPASANAESITLAYPEGNVVNSVVLHGVFAKLSLWSLLRTSIYGDEVSVHDATLVLQAPLPDRPVLVTADPTSTIPVEFERIIIPKFDVIAGDAAQPTFKINSTEASLRFNKAGNEKALHLYRGKLQLAAWPPFDIDRAVLEFNGAEIEVSGLRLTDSQPKRGTLELAGTIRPFVTETPSVLSVKFQNFNLGALLGQDFSELISAKIDNRAASHANSNCLSFTPGSSASVVLDVAFKSSLASSVNIKGFPFLFSLVRLLNDKWYEDPFFVEESTGVVHRKNSVIELRELNLESKSRMAIKGNIITAADKSLSGTLELSQNSKIDAMLGPPRDGFRWLNLELDGTLAHPSDNFARLYAAAKEAAAATEPPATVHPEPDPAKAFDDLTRPKGP